MGTREASTRLLKRVSILKLLKFRVVLICISGFNTKIEKQIFYNNFRHCSFTNDREFAAVHTIA